MSFLVRGTFLPYQSRLFKKTPRKVYLTANELSMNMMKRPILYNFEEIPRSLPLFLAMLTHLTDDSFICISLPISSSSAV